MIKKNSKLKKYFKDETMLENALTHKSWVNENKGKRRSNERLEYLGDAVLELVVSFELYKRFPKKEEGYLTALRANLVNTKNLAGIAEKLKIGDELFLSKGEEESGGRTNTSLLANTVEALIGAMFIDQGLEMSYQFIKENLMPDIEKKAKEPLKDPKSLLQEKVQAKSLPTPKYKVTSEEGPDHFKTFVVEAVVGKETFGKGKGKSKIEAAQKAAKNALDLLEKDRK